MIVGIRARLGAGAACGCAHPLPVVTAPLPRWCAAGDDTAHAASPGSTRVAVV